MSRVRALVVAGPGTNRDRDVLDALELAGADTHIVLASELVERPSMLDDVRLAVVAGGFSYADSLGAGRMLALDLALGVGDALRGFVADGRPLIGICNGFQVLTAAGMPPRRPRPQRAGTLRLPVGGARRRCRRPRRCGRPESTHRSTARSLTAKGATCIPTPTHSPRTARSRCATAAPTRTARSPTSPGSCDPSGVVLGLMPHPENHIVTRQHPRHSRGGGGEEHLGLRLFDNGIRHAKGL